MGKQKPQPAVRKAVTVKVKPKKNLLELWLKITLFVFAFVLYGNTSRNGYSLDDLYVTYNNPVVKQGVQAIPKIFGSLYINNINAEESGSMNFGYRPIAKAMFAVEHQLFGDNPGPSHIINVILYGLNIILLFIMLRRILPAYSPWFAFFVSMLWAAHPLHTEVVASLKNREEILSFMFAILSVLTFLKYIHKHKAGYIIGGSFLFLLSLMAKPGTLTFIVSIPLILYFFTETKPRTLVITGLSLLAITYLSLQVVKHTMPFVNRPVLFIENPLLFEKDIFLKLGTALYALLYYIRLLIFPHPLVFYYGYDMIPVTGFGNPWVILSLLIHLALFAYAIWKIKEKHLLSFAILFYLVTISMFANILKYPTGIIAERFLYIASLSFCIAVVYFVFKIFKQVPETAVSNKSLLKIAAVLALLVIPYTVKTNIRNKDWKSEMSLFSNDLKYLGKSAKAHYIYANALKSEMIRQIENTGSHKGYDAQISRIMELLNKTVAIYPGYFEAWNTLGEIEIMMKNNTDKAIEYFGKAAEVRPGYAAAWYNLGYAYFQKQDAAKALEYFRRSVALDSTNLKAMSNLATCYHKTGNADSAIFTNERIINQRPGVVIPYVNNASIYLAQNDSVNAVKWLEKAAAVKPDNKRVTGILARYFSMKGDKQKAEFYQELFDKAKENN